MNDRAPSTASSLAKHSACAVNSRSRAAAASFSKAHRRDDRLVEAEQRQRERQVAAAQGVAQGRRAHEVVTAERVFA